MSSQLFRIFGKEKVSGHSQLKASVQRAIRGALLPPPLPPLPLAWPFAGLLLCVGGRRSSICSSICCS